MADGQQINLYTLALGSHTLTVSASDYYGNATSASVTFTITATLQSLRSSVINLHAQGMIDNREIRNSLLAKLDNVESYLAQGKRKNAIKTLQAFVNQVHAQSGKHVTSDAATSLSSDALWVINHL